MRIFLHLKPLAIVAAFSLLCFAWANAAELKTQSFSGGQYPTVAEAVALDHNVNLLAFPGAKLVRANSVDSPDALADGQIGTFGGGGRVAVHANPSRVVYYLGGAKKIQAIKIWTGNIDSRSHQDWEVRLVDNSANPGKEPDFPKDPSFTSGDKILGAGAGAFCSTLANEDGSPTATADWVEFRLWRSYPTKPGDPAKAKSPANNWASYLELACLGDPNDPALFPSEEAKKEWLLKQAQAKLAQRLAALAPDAAAAVQNMEALRLMIESLGKEFPGKYDAAKYMAKWEEYNTAFEKLASPNAADEAEVQKLLALVAEFNTFRREAILANPYLAFDKILARQSGNGAFVSNWISPVDRGRGQYNDKLVTVSIKEMAAASAESRGTDAPLTTVFEEPNKSLLADICMHWDAKRFLVTALNPEYKRWQIYELNIDGTGYRQVTPDMGRDIDNAEGCYTPDGAIIFCSSASMMGVPCIGGSSLVANIFRVEKDGKTVRQLTFEQDQDWFPTVMNNGRIMYLRWEYVDMCHYFSRIIMTMNPDGTRQLAHYGSGSYWPNSLFYAKSMPGHPTKFSGIVSGHHGVSRIGELHIFDPMLGDHEADGVVQQIPGRGKKVEARIVDQLVNSSWPKFVSPTPLSENYILVNCQPTSNSRWGLYLVDTFDNMTLLYEAPDFVLWEPTPVMERPLPPVIPSQFVDGSKEATAFISDIYFGPGLKDVPRGTVKKLRILSYQYGYRGIGNHDLFGLESSWDAKRIIGEVPVYEDGSASFKIPANVPLSLQPLDENGAAVQLFRSWLVGMPGERVSCIGCHENQNSVTPRKLVEASRQRVSEITPFFGPVRGYGYAREVQPVMDKYCAGCHNGENPDIPNFADITPSHATYSVSYHNAVRYVRRPGPESDQKMFNPMEWHSSTSELIQKLNKGHHNVKLDDEAWERIHCWIDCNAPYHSNWMDIASARNRVAHVENMAKRTQELRDLYADIPENPEEDFYFEKPTERPEFVKPEPMAEIDRSAPTVAGFPFALAEGYEPERQTVEAGGEKFEMVKIPAGSFVMGDEMGEPDEFPRKAAKIEKPFWMMTTEVTNALYSEFDPTHDSRYVDQWWKDHTTPGYPANLPDQPVIRVTWNEAQEFCKWLSEKTGKKFRLPTEEEWEFAARAGSAQVFPFGGIDVDFAKYANMADESVHKFFVTGVNPQPSGHQEWQMWIPHAKDVNDGHFMQAPVGSYLPNGFGLYDMHGNVWEWTATSYKDGTQQKTVKGGSWLDRPKRCRSGMKLPYEAWQKVENVGFRVICEQ